MREAEPDELVAACHRVADPLRDRCGSPGSTRTAASPQASSSDGWVDATTGVPQAMASTIGMPKPSNMEGKANTEAPR